MNDDNNMLNAINVAVIGGNHHNTLGVVRSLGEQGVKKENIHILLIGKHIPNQNIISVSKYVIRENVDNDDSYETIIGWLTRLSKDGIKRVVICCSDGASEVIISNKNKLLEHYYIPLTNIDISQLMKKDMQDELAENCGLHTPKSIVISPGSNFTWNHYPCISNPLKSIIGAGKHDICIASSEGELKKILAGIKAEKAQVQEYISKEFEYQLIGCSLNAGETVIIPGYTKILRQPSNTNTGYLEYAPIESFDYNSKAVYAFIRKIGYSGLFSMEFIRDNNGNDYFLEINMRNDGNAYCVKSAGINLPFIWCYYSIFGKIPDIPLSFEKTIRFIPDFNDLKVALSQKCISKWFIDFFKAESHSIYNSKDIKPFVVEIVAQIRRHLR